MMNALHGFNDSTLIDGLNDNVAGRSGYLKRLRQRETDMSLKRVATLGVVGGLLLILLPGMRYLFKAEANNDLCRTLMIVGAALLCLGLFLPHILKPIEKPIYGATSWIGKIIMTVLLGVLFLVFVTPVGLAIRALKGKAPFFRWGMEKNPDQDRFEGWVDKISNADKRAVNDKVTAKNLLLQPFSVVSYFVSQGQWAMIPVLILLLMLGLLLFFAQGSALAPFIYTSF